MEAMWEGLVHLANLRLAQVNSKRYTISMNTKALIAVILVIVLAVGVAAFVILKRNSTNNPSFNQTETDETMNLEDNEDPSGFDKKSLSDLIGMGSAQECTYQDLDTQTSGTAYIADQKVRTDFTTVASGDMVGSHAVFDGDKIYIWMDGQTSGFVMTPEENVAVDTTSSDNTVTNSVNLNREIDYNCSNWSVDNSKFELPSGVDFQDLSSMLDDVTKTMGDAPAVDCSMCDSLPAESVDSCRTSLGC